MLFKMSIQISFMEQQQQQQQQQDQEHIIPTIRLCLIGEQGFGLSINKLSRATGGQREVLCQNLNKVSNHPVIPTVIQS